MISCFKEFEDLFIYCHDGIDKFESVFSHAAPIHPESTRDEMLIK